MSKDFLTFMRNRVSQPKLNAPAPTKEEWDEILEAASRAADHGGLKPWRFKVYEGEGRKKLGEIYWQHAKSEVDALPEEKKDSFIKKAFRAPQVLLIYANIVEHPKVPNVEQVMAVSAAAQQVLLGLNALGFGAMWRSGPACFTERTNSLLGLETTDQIVGLIYVGTPDTLSITPKHVDLEGCVEWVSE
ncbi:nitroreductase family protein [Marinomonas balearica]|uniref:Putative NAD(P)H nitroreductase n=1 Tax=Marinomonas balearica TaxID=491947 RepID=A0A4V3CG89_9GAMM|nr:nitroreductase [Marinomonas balearica]TDO96792.1 nitroreductase [Marinomonas balearica]